MATLFFLSKLKPKADAKEYERWVREVDYPTSKKLKSIKSYKAHKIHGPLMGEQVYDYIEVIEVTSLEDYKKDLTTAAAKKIFSDWSKFIGEYVADYGEAL